MQLKDLIQKKRDGLELSTSELEALLDGYLDGELTDYQMAAWLMAVYFRGLTPSEIATWTRLMWKSGKTFPRATREDYWIDKHSTGGVGDKPSLILVPLVVAVCRRIFGAGKVRIPMVSGRGLGHSGGTLDKLETVPGFSPSISVDRAMHLIAKHDYFMMGQTEDLVPADRRIYSLRDVTATVESVPLIVSSIMSKKLAENLDGLVFDVKTGAGAFMKTEAQSRELAGALLGVAKAQGVDAVAVLSRMDEPLGRKVGNSLEVEECSDFLENKSRDAGLAKVCLTLAAWMVKLGSRGQLSFEAARGECERELEGTTPLEIFQEMFAAQGGRWEEFQRAREKSTEACPSFVYIALSRGYVKELKALPFGLLLNSLGGGRTHKDAAIDPKVGFEFFKKVGEPVAAGEPIVKVIYRKPAQLESVKAELPGMVTIVAEPVKRTDWIVESLK